MNASPDHLVLEHNFTQNLLADVDCREKDLSYVLQEEYYNDFPKN